MNSAVFLICSSYSLILSDIMSFMPVLAIASTRLFLLFSRIFKVDFASLYSKSDIQDLLYCSLSCFVITFILSSLKKNSTNLSITKLSRYSHLRVAFLTAFALCHNPDETIAGQPFSILIISSSGFLL